MTLEKARELLGTQANFAGGYNRNAARLIHAEVTLEHCKAASDGLVRELRLDQIFGLATGKEA